SSGDPAPCGLTHRSAERAGRVLGTIGALVVFATERKYLTSVPPSTQRDGFQADNCRQVQTVGLRGLQGASQRTINRLVDTLTPLRDGSVGRSRAQGSRLRRLALAASALL